MPVAAEVEKICIEVLRILVGAGDEIFMAVVVTQLEAAPVQIFPRGQCADTQQIAMPMRALVILIHHRTIALPKPFAGGHGLAIQ